jgi:two-component system phosphate regulon sensor histidine kinase PhoR
MIASDWYHGERPSFIDCAGNITMVNIDDMEAASHKQVALIDALIAALPDPVIIVDRGPAIFAANAAARAVFGVIRDGDVLAYTIRTPNVLEAVELVLAGAQRQTVKWHERVPVERLFDIFVSPFAIDGQPAAVLELRDVTEAHRVERMRVNFVANVSHELRTPLTSVLGFIETLQGPAREDPAAREKFLEIMGEQARRMARLVDDLLSLSRIELNEHVRPQTPVDLAGIVRHIADSLEPMARENGATILVEAPEEAIILGDADELTRLAENLVENAIKYGGRPDAAPEVRISLVALKAGTELCVADNGPGIAAQHIPRLTERFYRVDTPVSRAKGGTGLGLAIVKHIVARHRGRLEIQSQLGAGTKFRARFPIFQ